MKPWLKITLGCLAVATIVAFLSVVGIVAFGFWAKNKIQEVTGGGPEVEAARKTANAVAFSRPANSLVAEDRLVRFIKVRAEVFSVYEKYKGEIETRAARLKGNQAPQIGDLAGDLATGLTFVGELQRAEALALATQAMPEDEYAFITEEVYKSMWTDFGSSKSEGNPARQVSKAVQSASDALKNVDGKGLPKEAADALENASAGLSQGASEVSESLERVRTPAENVALFKKYEADLKKYAMPGLGALFGDEQKDRGPRNKPS